ncbi:MAG: alpha/beta hydrolase [Chloroflexota bacterium]|nr:alpha/beta hydrolase [Chloroflexota bacterium]
MPYQLPPDPRTERRARITGWITFGFAAVLVALLAYFGYIAYEGSRQLADHPSPTTDCRTPATLGWPYEAINYDPATDAALEGVSDCTGDVEPARNVVAGPGGIGLAGWYVPAASGAGPSAPTVVVAHGWGSNKSNMLERAAILHDAYNLVLFDFRNHGQSAEAPTTQGVREAGDLRAILDWLEATKGPSQIAVLGVSMGGASALNAADDDERIDALIIESAHATLANAAEARLTAAGYPLALPGSWAILLGSLIRTGEDVSSADPIGSVRGLEDRPLLLITGELDGTIGPTDAEDMRRAAAQAGVPVELHVCDRAGHSQSYDACAEEYRGWVLGFLQRVLAPAG